MPKSVASPASPVSYPWPMARYFHSVPRRYSSPKMKALSTDASVIENPSSTSPDRSATVIRRSSSSPKREPPYRLAATTRRSTSSGTAVRSRLMRSSLPPSVGVLPSNCTLPSAAAGLL